MAVASDRCPDVDELAAFASGDVSAGRSQLVAHLDHCADCRRVVAAAAAEDDEAGDDDAKPTEVRTGPRIGRFIIQRILGEGAMGIVHLAYDPELKRNVALKVIKPDSGDLLASERLLLEAQTAAQLSHKNAVTIYDVGVHEGQPYVAMEYVEGTTVASWLKKNAAWREALAVMLAAGDGLAAAHKAGLVHRDFKPGNILLGTDGAVKVSDFGLARFADERMSSIAAHEEALEIPRSARAVTSTGVLVGTPAYTSPEQFSGATATSASDQFAFGVALYRALYGTRPFRGPTLYAVYEAIVNDPPPRPPRDSRVPSALWPIVERALAKKPEARFAGMAELLAALREASGLGMEPVLDERCPFPGLVSFAEADAKLYFGRSAEVNEVLGRLRDQATVAVVGPSGAGKSSFVRALAVPSLRRDDPSCEVLVMRPGAHPLLTLARLIGPLSNETARSLEELAAWIRTDPSRLGIVLGAHARHYDSKVVLYVDQLEELYTQCQDRDERLAFARAIAAIGADPGRPLRLAVTIRSDFLDRAAECSELMARITAGFVFLGPPGRATLVQALVGPLAAVGYELEDPAIADEIASSLDDQPGAFPLLQFVGGRLWDERDRERRRISRASLSAIGSVAGALATHADHVLSQLSPGDARLARAILLRLVTPEGTRLALPVRELASLSSASDAERVVDVLVRGRLLVADADTVELVHEALIVAWPTFRRWLDDEAGDAKLLADLGASARRWDAVGRPEGMLWTGEPARQAIALAARGADVTTVEAAFIAATRRVARRSGRRRRIAVIAVLAVLASIAIVATAGFFRVRESEQQATAAAHKAEEALRDLTEAEASTNEANVRAGKATEQVELSAAELARKNTALEGALTVARDERQRAEDNATRLASAVTTEKSLRDKLDQALKAANAARAEVDQALKIANAARAELEKKVKALEASVVKWKKEDE